MKGFMWGARGPFLPAVAMVVMVVVGNSSLGHVSTVGIVHITHGKYRNKNTKILTG
jgi:hypothetical protein